MHDDDLRDPIAEATRLRDIAFNEYADEFERHGAHPGQVNKLRAKLEDAQNHLVSVRKKFSKPQQQPHTSHKI